jgi:hypothetical protein
VLSLFAVPKAFSGQAAVIQNNALGSWTRLGGNCDVVLLGDDPGVAEAAAWHAVGHEPAIERNAFGTPMLSHVLGRMERRARFPYLGLVNADIVLLDDFLPALAAACAAYRDFLLVSSRYNCDIAGPLAFEPGWAETLRARARDENRMYPAAGSDIFVFTQGLFDEVPDLAVGRGYWDNWLMRAARRKRVPMIDATPCLTAVHQEHGYDHVPGVAVESSAKLVYRSEEGRRNLALAGGHSQLYTVFDATHVLTPDGRMQPTLGPSLVYRRLKALTRRIVRGLTIRNGS